MPVLLEQVDCLALAVVLHEVARIVDPLLMSGAALVCGLDGIQQDLRRGRIRECSRIAIGLTVVLFQIEVEPIGV